MAYNKQSELQVTLQREIEVSLRHNLVVRCNE